MQQIERKVSINAGIDKWARKTSYNEWQHSNVVIWKND
jgi:hypothetical protein